MTPRAERAGPRRRASLVLTTVVVLSAFLALAHSSPPAAAAAPQLAILSPTDGSVFGNGTPVAVQLSISGFVLVQPGRVGQVAAPGEGHAVVYLDGQLVRLVTTLDPFALAVTSGPHALRAELVDDNGTPLSPAVSDTVTFVSTLGPATGVPTVRVVSPFAYESTGHGFWVTLEISNFTLVGGHGQPNAPNEGHIQILVLGAVVMEITAYAPVILVAMPDGDITIAVRLVNNDNTRLNPDVSQEVPIHVTASSSVTLPLILNGGATLLLGFTLIVLILRRRHLAARSAKPGREEP